MRKKEIKKRSQNREKVQTRTPVYRTFKIRLEKVFGVLIKTIPQLWVYYVVLDSAYAMAGYVRTLEQYGLTMVSILSLKNNFILGRVPRCARVGVLRATLSLRCFALLTHPPHASRSSFGIFYLVFRHILALPCLILIIKYLQD
ncbi:MAG: hypothetical protein NZ455_06240 [Bacteroidia bacterium]|nr:hypothetical protein [Bacteroidia bacterium]